MNQNSSAFSPSRIVASGSGKRLDSAGKPKCRLRRLCTRIACAIASFSFAASAMCDVIHITEGSSSGYTLTDGNTYVIDNSVSFSNETVGGSGITIADNATVVVFIPANITLTATGASSGAGIQIPNNATLVITGEGSIVAKGGDATNGGNGQGGGSGSAYIRSEWDLGGTGGRGGEGGAGGRGAGAGIGGGSKSEMGTCYILGSISVSATGGSHGSYGATGGRGSAAIARVGRTGSTGYWFCASGGGGGGGAGGPGGAACAIGGGGGDGGKGYAGKDGSVTSSRFYYDGYTPPIYLYDWVYGDDGLAGSAGSIGNENSGTLYVSATASVNVSRKKESATTHSAAQYTIVFDPNGGKLCSSQSSTIATIGCALPDCIAAPMRDEGLFCGWTDDNGTKYYESDGSKSFSCYSIPDNVTLYAEWAIAIDEPIVTITPSDGTIIEESQSVMISSRSSEACVYYTLDGSDPTEASPVYQRRFRVSGKTTVKAIAVFEGWTNSEVAVAHYALGQCPDPVIVSAGGATFSHGSVQVSIDWECADGVLRYTTDGSDVTETSPEYAGVFTIDDTTTIKAKAFGETYFDSKQVELTVTREWEPVAPPLITAAESFSGRKTMVSISCATKGATIRYTVDGSEPDSHSMRYSGAFEVHESTVVKAFAMLADYANSEVATKTITKVWGIGDSVGLPDHAFTTDGDAGWVNDGGAAMRSGKIAYKQTSVLRSTFVGKGRLTFELKTSCEEDLPEYMEYDRAEIWVNGVLKMKQDGVHDWMPFEFDLDGASTTVEWRYVKDDVDDANYPGEDCIWVRNIVWMPELTCTTEVPVEFSWIRERFGDLGNYYYDYEEKAKETAANGHKVWECYVAGEDPMDRESRFTATIKMGADGKPIVSWKPPLNGEAADGAGIREGVRSYSVYGKQSLDDAAGEWTPVAEGNERDYRFFKVRVGMPEQK